MFRFGFLGGGQMAEAIIGGLQKQTTDFNLEYILFDPNSERKALFNEQFNIGIAKSNEDVMKNASVLFLAVKPQIFPEIQETLAKHYREGQIIVSIMAGVEISTIEEMIPQGKVIRLMPNTAMAVGEGTCLFTANEAVTEKEKTWMIDVLSTLGLVEEIPEVLMNGATAISGSGPAFFYTMIDSMVLGGIEVGLSKKTALRLATQTMLGAAKLLQETQKEVSVLRDNVLSPGGTTIEGVRILEERGFRSSVIEAIVATRDKGAMLGKRKDGSK